MQLLRVNVTFNDWMHYFPINKENKNTRKQKIKRKHGSRKVSGPWSQHLPWGSYCSLNGQEQRGQHTISEDQIQLPVFCWTLSYGWLLLFKGLNCFYILKSCFDNKKKKQEFLTRTIDGPHRLKTTIWPFTKSLPTLC